MTTAYAKFNERPEWAKNRHEAPIPNGILGTMIFVGTEMMMFMGFISAFYVIKATNEGIWAPVKDITLPITMTAVNTAILLFSGFLMHFSVKRAIKTQDASTAMGLFKWATALGVIFVSIQGYEWIKLLGYGMSMTSGIFGATFFLLIGCHALHAFASIILMFSLIMKNKRGAATVTDIRSMRVFWTFVVAIWPVLYKVVYLT